MLIYICLFIQPKPNDWGLNIIHCHWHFHIFFLVVIVLVVVYLVKYVCSVCVFCSSTMFTINDVSNINNRSVFEKKWLNRIFCFRFIFHLFIQVGSLSDAMCVCVCVCTWKNCHNFFFFTKFYFNMKKNQLIIFYSGHHHHHYRCSCGNSTSLKKKIYEKVTTEIHTGKFNGFTHMIHERVTRTRM